VSTADPRPTVLSDSVHELDSNLRAYLSARGDAPSLRARAAALDWICAHPGKVQPRLVSMLSPDATTAPTAVLSALARIGAASSVPAMEELLRRGNAEVSLAAAEALAAHQSPRAAASLRRALRSRVGLGAVSAARVSARRFDAAILPLLQNALLGEDALLRFHALRAAVRLGGVSVDRLERMASEDPDPDVRRLAAELLE